jgi:hypothetical protein
MALQAAAAALRHSGRESLTQGARLFASGAAIEVTVQPYKASGPQQHAVTMVCVREGQGPRKSFSSGLAATISPTQLHSA